MRFAGRRSLRARGEKLGDERGDISGGLEATEILIASAIDSLKIIECEKRNKCRTEGSRQELGRLIATKFLSDCGYSHSSVRVDSS